MKKTVVTLFALLTACLTCYAQATVGLQQLSGTKWMLVGSGDPDEMTMITTITSTSITNVIDYKIPNGVVTNTYQYYLSETFPAEFDFSKVGKASRGRYIVEYNSKMNEAIVYEFISIKGNVLTLHFRPDPKRVIIGPRAGTRMIFKRIE